MISVVNYGAKGDGITDDTLSFQKAQLAAGGADISVPAGKYLISGLNSGSVRLSLVGVGIDASVLKIKRGGDGMAIFLGSPYSQLKDCTIDATDGVEGGYGVFHSSYATSTTRVRIIKPPGIGIGLWTGAKAVSIEDCVIESPFLQGINFLDRNNDYSGTYIKGTKVVGANLDAIQIGGKGSVVIEGCILEDGMFSGIYCLTGSRKLFILNNSIQRCYAGIDVSWGNNLGVPDATGSRTGPDNSENIVLEGNTILKCAGGIGTGSNGTVIANNTILDSGYNYSQSYSLLHVLPLIVSPGSGYKVKDMLSFAGGTKTTHEGFLGPTAKVQVTAIDANGGIASMTVFHIGVYAVPPVNPISLSGGSGSGSKISITKWNPRGFWREGIGIIDAKNCVVANNISSNTSGNGSQQVGFVFSRIYQYPSRTILVGNKLSGNALYPFKGRFAGRYSDNMGAGHTIAGNT